MKNFKSYIYFGLTVLLMSCALLYCIHRMNEAQRDYERQTSNVDALTTEPSVVYLHDSSKVIKVPVVSEEVKELRKQKLIDSKIIKELRIRLKDVKTYSNQEQITTDKVVMARTGDSIFEYSDKWTKIRADMKYKSCEYSVRDSMITVVSRVYKHHFLWWRWGTKGYQMQIINYNPHTDIIYNRFITVGD